MYNSFFLDCKKNDITCYLNVAKNISNSDAYLGVKLYEYINEIFPNNIWSCIELLNLLLRFNDFEKFKTQIELCLKNYNGTQLELIESFKSIDFKIIDIDSDILLDTIYSFYKKETPKQHKNFSVFGDKSSSSFKLNTKIKPSALPEINLKEYKNRIYIVSPGIVVDCNNSIYNSLRQFSYEAVNSGWLNKRGLQRVIELKRDMDTKRLYGDYILLSRVGDHIYGHWLLDILPKVFLTESKFKGKFKYIVSSSIPKYALNWLKLFGVEKERLFLWYRGGVSLELDNIYFVSNLRYNNEISSKLIDFANYIKNKVELRTDKIYEKIFISRKKLNSTKNNIRVLDNIDNIEAIVKKYGYKVVYPESMSLKEQINMFANSKIIIGEDGSALHNSIFASKGITVVNIRNSANGSLIQGNLCELFQQKIIYIFGNLKSIDKISSRNSTYSIDETVFEEVLMSLEGKV